MTDTYTQADLDRIVKEVVDYASQAAAQEARAVALEEAAQTIKAGMEDSEWFNPYRAILALLDTPAAEALERVRAEEREACAKVAVVFEEREGREPIDDMAASYSAGRKTAATAIAAAIRARGATPLKERQ